MNLSSFINSTFWMFESVSTIDINSISTVISIVLSVVSIVLAVFSIKQASKVNKQTNEVLHEITLGNTAARELLDESIHQNEILVQKITRELSKDNYNAANIANIKMKIQSGQLSDQQPSNEVHPDLGLI